MAINAYSSCPGGTGKKIKFCCGDLLDEFEQIERMVDGQQYLALPETPGAAGEDAPWAGPVSWPPRLSCCG